MTDRLAALRRRRRRRGLRLVAAAANGLNQLLTGGRSSRPICSPKQPRSCTELSVRLVQKVGRCCRGPFP